MVWQVIGGNWRAVGGKVSGLEGGALVSPEYDVKMALANASFSVGGSPSGRIIPFELCGTNVEFLYRSYNAVDGGGEMREPVPVTQIAPTGLRYPGGALVDGFDWTKAVGSSRQPMDLYYWRDPQVADFGVDEFLRLCESLGADPIIQVDIMANDAAAAAALVRYVNGPRMAPIGNLVADGDFDAGVAGWALLGGNATLTHHNGHSMRLTTTGGVGVRTPMAAYQIDNLVIGETYAIKIHMEQAANGFALVAVGTLSGGAETMANTAVTPGTNSYQFTAMARTQYLTLTAYHNNTGQTTTFNSVSVSGLGESPAETRCIRWQLGNEEYHSPNRTWRLSQADFVSRGLAYAAAMQAAQDAIDDTVKLKLYAPIHPNTAFNAFSYWADGGATVVDGLKDVVAGFAVHRYGSIAQAGPDVSGEAVHTSTMLWPVEFGEVLDASLALMDSNGAAGKELIVTEWGVTHGTALDYPYSNHVQTISTGAAYAGALNAMARRAPVAASYQFKLWGYDHQGLIGLGEGGSMIDPPGLITPGGLALGIWQWALAGKKVLSEVASSPLISAPPVGWSRGFTNEQSLDGLAAISEREDEIGVVLVNRNPTQTLDVAVALPDGFSELEMRFLWGRAPDAAPGTDGPSDPSDYDFQYTNQDNVWRFDQRGEGEIALSHISQAARSPVVRLLPGTVTAIRATRALP